MKMKKPRLVGFGLLAVSVLAALVAPAVASAQTDEPTVEGRGALWASGSGDVDIEMSGRLTLELTGDIEIVDHAGDLSLQLDSGDGPQAESRAGEPEFEFDDFTGRMTMRGSHFSVEIDGEVRFRARGRGEAVLDGEGVWKTRRGDRMVWEGMVTLGDGQIGAA